MEDNENLEMSLFDSGLELNLDYNPEDIVEDDQDDDPDSDKDQDKDKIDVNEDDQDDDPDKVVDDKDKDPDDGDEQDQDDDASSSNIYSSFASVLNEQGLLPSLDLENNTIDNIEGLTEAFKSELSNQAKNYIVDKIGAEGYESLEKGVSLSEYQQYQDDTNVLDSISDESLDDDIELAKKIILQDYNSQGISEDKALRFLKRSIEIGDDAVLEDAKQSLESLKVVQSKKLDVLKQENASRLVEQQEQQEKIDNDLKNSIYTKEEIIKGVVLNKSVQDKIYNSITKVVSTDPNTGILENQLMKDRRESPIEFDTKLYYLYELTNGFQDFSKLVTKSKSKASAQLEKTLRSNKSFDDSGQAGFLNDENSYDGIGGEIVF
jgi:hypothetical protein